MRAGCPDPKFFQESIIKEEKHLDSCLARTATGEDFRATERRDPKELRGLRRTNTAPHPFRSTLTRKDRTLLAEFRNRPTKAKHDCTPPYAAIMDKDEGTEYRRTFGGGCPWASTHPDFTATLSRWHGTSRPSTTAAASFSSDPFGDSFPERPVGTAPPSPVSSRHGEASRAAKERLKKSPWVCSFSHLPKESTAKGAHTLQDREWPAHLSRIPRPEVDDKPELMFSVPFTDLISADGRMSTIIRPHGCGSLVKGPLQTTSSFRRSSQRAHF